MDLALIRTILDLVREHELSEFEIEHDGLRLRIRKEPDGAQSVAHSAPATPSAVMPAAASVPQQVAGSTAPAAADLGDAEIELAVVNRRSWARSTGRRSRGRRRSSTLAPP